MSFKDFLNEQKSAVIKNVIISDGSKRVGGAVSKDTLQVTTDSIELDDAEQLVFSVTPALGKDDDKDVAEVVFATITAQYRIDASFSKQTHDTPESTEFEINKKSIVIKRVDIEDEYKGDEYGDVTDIYSRLKTLVADKDLLADAVVEVFEYHIDEIFDLYKEDRQ